MRKRNIVAMVFAVSILGCFPQAHVSVKNDCPGAYFRVSKLEGSGHFVVVDPALVFGERAEVSLTGVAGQQNKFVIMVDGFNAKNGKPLGSATKDMWVTPTPGELTAPKNNESWEVSQLYPYGCPDLVW